MLIPAFKDTFNADGSRSKPRIAVLEISDPEGKVAKPLMHLLIERTEVFKYDENGAIQSAQLTFSYEELKGRYGDVHGYKNEFKASFSAWTNSVSLTSSSNAHGYVGLDLGLKGHRIGTYFFTHIVEWAQQNWPDAQVNQIELLTGQATTNNKARRNRFYERYGIRFDYKDGGASGNSLDMLVRDLVPVQTWRQNIREIQTMDYLSNLIQREEMLALDLEHRQRAVKELAGQLRRIEAAPLRWALAQTVVKMLSLLPHALLITAAGVGVWRWLH